MNKNYREYLEEQLEEANERFEKAKRESIKEIENLNFFMAEDYGAAYVSHIDKITAAATKIKTLGEAIQVYDYMQNK